MNQNTVDTFATKVITDLAAAYAGALTNIGHKLGLYQAMAGAGPLTPQQLAANTGTGERYVREWLGAQVVGGYVRYEPSDGTYTFPDEHAHVLADSDSPLFIAPAFDGASSMWLDEDKTLHAFRTGEGLPWGQHDHRLFHATEALFRNGYRQNLTEVWIPELCGIADRLARGGSVIDVGCGHGVSTILMARAFPNASILGVDIHQESIEVARRRAVEAGVADRARFEAADVLELPGRDVDLICFMDSFHDLGRPVEAARRAYEVLADDGALLLVEPAAADRLEDNRGPVSRLYYCASTTMCTANALSQGDVALGAQAGTSSLSSVLHDAGFTRVRVMFETAFNLILEVRK
jgi:ubiquinone/menaquinone biosynthesis C-methylase UbiE